MYLQTAERRGRSPSEFGGLLVTSAPLIVFLLLPFVALCAAIHPSEWLSAVCSPAAIQALLLSIETTLAATGICLVGGLPIALLLARHSFPGRRLLSTLIDLPISVPPVVAGVCLLLAFGRTGLVGKHLHALGIDIGFTTIAVVLAQIMIASPFLIKTAAAGFEAIDPDIEDYARVSGAGTLRVFWAITLPLAAPSVVAGTLLAWARALSEFGATMMFAGNFPGRTQTLPLAVMSAFETDLDTAIAISTIALILSISALIAARTLAQRWKVTW
ncbi:MAG: ABC transporter permease [Capsulimonadaceae bacterium]|nr:ABC transporter permease [Capsulimonadaceae bacterium]